MYPILSKTRSYARTITGTIKGKTAALATALLIMATASGQSVSEIVTDYNGYWKSGVGAINAVKPDNSHNLLSFSYNGIRYSTGVNDSLLTARGNTFVAGDFRALPVSTITGAVNSNTKIGLGAMYDGVANGASNPKPENNLPKYLTDGKKGLDLGTCVANLPAGNLFFPITVKAHLIGDNIPDLLITQVADPSGSSLDSYEFTDISGNRVGNKVDITLSGLPVVGNWTVDFYEAHQTPMTLTSGYTKTDRPIRFWAADFSLFGINSTNIDQVAYFKIRLNGNSDVAFVAYNNKTLTIINNSLPVQLTSFTGTLTAQQQVELKWQTVTEINSDHYVIENSKDGINYTAIDSVTAAGWSNSPKLYKYTHQNPKAGKSFYRLKQLDKDGTYTYSSIVTINNSPAKELAVSVYPNPATDKVTMSYQRAGGTEQCQLVNMQGTVLMQSKLNAGSTQTSFDVQHLPAGSYLLVWKDGADKQTKTIVKR